MNDTSEFHHKIQLKINDIYPNISFSIEKSKNIFSNNEVQLDEEPLQQIKSFIKLIFKLSHDNKFTSRLLNKYKTNRNKINFGAKNYSVLMSYDFHIVNNVAKLIEINTNASSYLVGDLIAKVKTNKSYTSNLKDSFLEEFKLSSKEIKNIAIIDEKPHEQNLYLEFLLYKSLFLSWGYDCSIIDVNDLIFKSGIPYDKNSQPIDFIYNRYCDFYLAEEKSKKLLDSYLNNKVVLSPHPREYFLLADKQRMIDWQQLDTSDIISESEKKILNKTLLKTADISNFEPEDLWKNKKKYFFKPKESFGGKSVYRGKGLTRKTFNRLLSENTIVQELAPPETIEGLEQSWKYDLRVYCYQDKIDQIVARTYQGQTTNATHLGGGITLVKT